MREKTLEGMKTKRATRSIRPNPSAWSSGLSCRAKPWRRRSWRTPGRRGLQPRSSVSARRRGHGLKTPGRELLPTTRGQWRRRRRTATREEQSSEGKTQERIRNETSPAGSKGRSKRHEVEKTWRCRLV